MSEKTYPIKNRLTREIRHVPLREYTTWITARDPSSGVHIYEPLSGVPGTVQSDGHEKQFVIPKERIYEAASGNTKMRILRSDRDPAWERARRSEVAYAKQRVAQDRSSAAVGLESFLSGVTFGGYSQLANSLAGEGAAEARAQQVGAHPAADLVGKAASLIALGFLPIPGLGAVSGAAKGGARMGSIFEASAAMSSAFGARITGKGFLSEVGRRLGRPFVFAAAAEGPLSVALASADLVDNNKEYTAEALASSALSQYGFAMLIGGAFSVPFGVAVAALPRIGKWSGAVARGVWRRTMRPHRGSIPGDVTETVGYQAIGKMSSKLGPEQMVRSKAGRWLAGEGLDDFMKTSATYNKAFQDVLEAKTPRQLRKGVKSLKLSVKNHDAIPGLQWLDDNAETVIVARQKLDNLFLDIDRYADAGLKTKFHHPKGLGTIPNNAGDLLNDALGKAGLPELKGNFIKRLDEAIALYRAHPQKQPQLAKDINKAYPGMKSWLDDIAEFDAAITGLKQWTAKGPKDYIDFENLLGPVKGSGQTNPNSIRAQLRKADGLYRKFTNPKHNVIKDTSAFTSGERPLFVQKGKRLETGVDTYFDNFKNEINGLIKARDAISKIGEGATPIFAARKPHSPIEMLDAQLDAVYTTKQRIWETLGFVALGGGGIRHTTVFGGVYTFRHAMNAQENRAIFSALHESISETASSVDRMQGYVAELVEPAASFDIELGTALAVTQASALGYLKTQLPHSGDRNIGPGDYSNAEIENFLEAVGAIASPMSVLATAADGSTTEQAVDALRTVYPQLYVEMVTDVAEFVDKYADALGHIQLTGLDTFTGYALGYSDGPAPNLTLQPPYYQTPGQASSVGGSEHRRMDLQQGTTPAQKVGSM